MGKNSTYFLHGKNSILFWFFLVVIASSTKAGIPSGYYDDASGKIGESLKSTLHDIVSEHTKKSYTQAWDIIRESDEDPNNSDNVILLYSGRSQDKEYRDHGSSWDYTQYDEGSGTYSNSWNREHVWAKSHGFPSSSDTAYTDCHHLRPVDRTVNSTRNNLDFDEGGSAHSEATDCNYDSDSWEPRDAVKGDVARMLFYMAVRYDPGFHSDDSEYDLEIIDSTGMDIGSAPGRPVIGKLSTLLAWHDDDPVDTFEANRNEVVYGYQGNRNPFIDHPEYVDKIWGEGDDESGDLIISGVYDGPLSGGTPKGVELFVRNNISDLSIYGLGSANNGGGTDGQEFTFSAVSASAGDYLYVAYESTEFSNWFGSSPDYTTNSMSINGDDAIELYCDGNVIDLFGDINVDGNGEVWEYLDGWAYSKDSRSKNATFDSGDWTFSGANALDGETSNATASTKIPVGTFKDGDSSLPVELSLWKAFSAQGMVKLLWTTDSEIENQGFIIERSGGHLDNSFQEIASFSTNTDLLGQGSTTAQNDYYLIDKQVKVGKTYTYRLSDVDYRGNVTQHAEISVNVKKSAKKLKYSDIKLHNAFPNPFNPDVNLSFTLENETAALSLSVYDIQGSLIKSLSTGYHGLGVHEFSWDGNNLQGHAVSSGVYIVRLNAGSVTQIQRMTLLR
jgi:endonuclease I/flagellar hook assembly protein FlgD